MTRDDERCTASNARGVQCVLPFGHPGTHSTGLARPATPRPEPVYRQAPAPYPERSGMSSVLKVGIGIAIAAWVIVAIAVVVVIGGFGGSQGSPSASPAAPTASIAPTSAEPSTATTEPSDVTPSGSAVVVYKVGVKVRIGNEQYFTVPQVDYDYTGTTIFKPPAGKKWVAPLAQIQDINPAGSSYGPLMFTLRDDQGNEYGLTPFGRQPELQASTSLKGGAIVRGYVTFEVPADYGHLTLVYTPKVGDPVEVALN